jgi:hypothetical protein
VVRGIGGVECSIGPALQENALTIVGQGFISVRHVPISEKDKGVLIDGTFYRERTMASFWSNVWAGRAFFFV